MNCARAGTSISAARSTAWQNAAPWEKAESPEMLSAKKDCAVNGEILEELFGSLVRVEHAQLQVEDRLAGDGEIEVAGLDDAGMNRADGNLEDAFAVGRPVDVPLAFKRGQHRFERKALAHRMHVGPVIVERNAARIRMPNGFEAKPILNLALLPVDCWQLRGQRREGGKSLGNGSLENHPAWFAGPVEDVVVVKNSFSLSPGLRRRRSRFLPGAR